MAIVEMKRLTLAVVRSQKQELLKELVQQGCVEFSEIDELVQNSKIEQFVRSESSKLMTYRQQQQSIEHAVEILSKAVPTKTKLLSAKPEKEGYEFVVEDGLDEAIELAGKIESLDDRIKRITADILRAKGDIESYKPWLEFDQDLSCTGTEYASLTIGTIPSTVDLNEVDSEISLASEEAEMFRISDDKAFHYVAIVCAKGELGKVQEAVRPYGFSAVSLGGPGTAKECTEKAQQEIAELTEEKDKCIQAIKDYADRKDELKFAYDRMSTKVSMAEAEERLYGTDTAVIMEGWVPAEAEPMVGNIFSKYDCAWETREPAEDEYPEVPVALKNNKVTSALNMVTNMYSLPTYGTVDPNPLMAPFFILFYGLMMADIGYGIIMIIAAVVALKKIKPREGTLSLCRLLLWCGISTLVMGILTGSFFSDIPLQIAQLIDPDTTWTGLPKLFSPTENSDMVLYGSMILGAIHLNTGMVISFVQKVKKGNIADAIFNEGALWLILITGILAVLGIGFINGIPVFLIAAILLLLFGAGRESKGFGKVTAAFSCIYNTATGWFGDVLSYARIMALMLAGGVVGQVFNTVAIMPAKSSGINVVTVLAFIVIFLFGHAMNFALNILGCYVHDLRLQCLEYFGKFYEAGGKPFKPLKINSKYINVEE